jgi:hypothetical protein
MFKALLGCFTMQHKIWEVKKMVDEEEEWEEEDWDEEDWEDEEV